jgi:cobalt/nickel transport system permease protein
MMSIMKSLYNLKFLDDLARKDSLIHRVHPLAKVLVTMLYLIAVVSYDKYEISGLLPFIFYPLLMFALADLPVKPILLRVLLVEPLVIGIGILNPLFDQELIRVAGIEISRGWITFLSIFIRGGLTVTAALLLIATTGMNRLAEALRMLRVPKLFVLQLLLTYRYISVLMEEVATTLRAYSMRAPGQKGIKRSAWGSLAGQMLLRTFDRAQRVYQAMCLRGFTGEYLTGRDQRIRLSDWAFLVGWSAFLIALRIFNLPILLGSLLTGVIIQ